MASDPDSCLINDGDDDLLNFSLDDDDDTITKPPCSLSNPNSHALSFPEFVEEELEWLTNKDAFPALDDILSNPNQSVIVSVLDNNSITSCCGSVPLNYPVKKRSARRRKGCRQCWWWDKVILEPLGRRKCQHCLAEETPQWRAGPTGPKTLCNACGVRYKSGRLVAEYRPANSPTFSRALHSNSHRKIMEMRKKQAAG